MRSIIEDLELEIEVLRQRCDAFEGLLGLPSAWEAPVPPMTLYQTRLMRILARKDAPASSVARLMASYYPNTSCDSIDVIAHRLRRILPANIAPRRRKTRSDVLSIPDRPALQAFLATGHLPQSLRQAA